MSCWVLTIMIMVVDLNDDFFEIFLLLIPPCAFWANERLWICAFTVMARSGPATQSAFVYFASTAERVSWKSRHDGLGSVIQINYREHEPYYQATSRNASLQTVQQQRGGRWFNVRQGKIHWSDRALNWPLHGSLLWSAFCPKIVMVSTTTSNLRKTLFRPSMKPIFSHHESLI